MQAYPKTIDLSVVVLAYKNGPILKSWVGGLHQDLSSLNATWEIILVCNVYEREIDEAQEVARGLVRDLPHVKIVARTKGGGYGWDVKSGLDTAQGEVLAYIDGDGQIPSDSVSTAYRQMTTEGWDLVKARRTRREDGIIRGLLSKIFNLSFRVIFRVSDTDINAKPKLFRRKAYQAMHLQSDDWFIDAEIMMKAKQMKLKIGEIPIEFHSLEGRNSLVGFKTILEFCKNFWRYRWKS
jgi:glycosyltransferase involved in cell wall biosynthesis